MKIYKNILKLLKLIDADLILKDHKEEFFNKLNIQNLKRLKFFSIIVSLITGILFYLDLGIIDLFPVDLNNGNSFILYSHLFLFISMGSVFIYLSKIDINNNKKFLRFIFNSYIFIGLIAITAVTIGDLMTGKGVIAFLGSLYFISIAFYFTNTFSFFALFINLSILIISIFLLKFPEEITRHHLINLITFTVLTWLVSRYMMYIKMIDFLKMKERKKLIIDLEESIDNIQQLSGLLPICANCKSIRDDKGYWNEIEIYFKDNSELDFSHSLCPTCLKNLYPKYSPGISVKSKKQPL